MNDKAGVAEDNAVDEFAILAQSRTLEKPMSRYENYISFIDMN